MATIGKTRTGKWQVRFTWRGKGHHITLGSVPEDSARQVAINIQRIIDCKKANVPTDAASAAWIRGLDMELRTRLVNYGLASATESLLLRDYLESRVQEAVKAQQAENTLKMKRQVRDKMLLCWGTHLLLSDLTPHHGQQFVDYVTGANNVNWARRQIQMARSFLSLAVDAGHIPINPFRGHSTAYVNIKGDRTCYITREQVDRLLANIRNWEWRFIIVMARYGGIRIPSEILPFRWRDFDFEQERITVTSPKMKRFGRGTRLLPMFPEIRDVLQERLEDRTLTPVSPKNAVLQTQREGLYAKFKFRIRRAGLKPWPKLWINMRSTRETELIRAGYPLHVVCEWLGNSAQVAHKHYLQVTEEDWNRATGKIPDVHMPAPTSIEGSPEYNVQFEGDDE